MSKRTSDQIYGALGEYFFKGEESLFNEGQLKLAQQHKSKLKTLSRKSKRERGFLKIRLTILKTPSYILYFISNVCGFIALPFQWMYDNLNSIGVDYENYIELNNARKERPYIKEMNEYAYKTVLPLLEELETDDMSEKHEGYLVKKGLAKKTEKIME